MPEIVDIIRTDGIDLVNNIRANMGSAGMNVTNETSHSLRFEIKQEGGHFRFTLLGRPYFMTVHTGRRPTPDKKPSSEMISRLTAWVEGRGMNADAVWAIATTIQKKGTKLFQEGGRTDIVDPAKEEFLKSLSEHLLTEMGDRVIAKVKEIEKDGNSSKDTTGA